MGLAIIFEGYLVNAPVAAMVSNQLPLREICQETGPVNDAHDDDDADELLGQLRTSHGCYVKALADASLWGRF